MLDLVGSPENWGFVAMLLKQKALISVHQVELVSIRNKFEDAGYPYGSWEPIGSDHLLNILVHMYCDAKNSNKYTEDPQILADLTLNFIQNMFDV